MKNVFNEILLMQLEFLYITNLTNLINVNNKKYLK